MVIDCESVSMIGGRKLRLPRREFCRCSVTGPLRILMPAFQSPESAHWGEVNGDDRNWRVIFPISSAI